MFLKVDLCWHLALRPSERLSPAAKGSGTETHSQIGRERESQPRMEVSITSLPLELKEHQGRQGGETGSQRGQRHWEGMAP